MTMVKTMAMISQIGQAMAQTTFACLDPKTQCTCMKFSTDSARASLILLVV